ncbi:MAG: hypothetical protein P857_795 [Candidatus Xenolissoclinum pacificiensis L6]|uniref:Uncharacterized protein n=1 Tax=Candidatus Xenolissoclinum pacificiensis L6 TaxID=1401685 RepID=W2V0J7_9RICK|nr:MAG: hypothetical protein P857_795 [Candidatus Xenolissoclinum pacificiensis L6]
MYSSVEELEGINSTSTICSVLRNDSSCESKQLKSELNNMFD